MNTRPTKILLLGISGAGKSTLAPLLAEFYKLNVYEADDEVMIINNNVWPHDDATVDKGFAIANEKALNSDNIIFVTSWLNKKDFLKFVEKEFKIVELHADLDELVVRKQTRDNSSEDHILRFRNAYPEYLELINDADLKSNFTLSVDTTRLSADELFKLIGLRL